MSSVHIPFVSGNRLLVPAMESGFLPPVIVGSEDWYNWLADEQHRSFSLRSHLGTCTVQRERQGNGWYWYAYRKKDGKIRKTYLGKSKDLTLKRLNLALALLIGKDTDDSTLERVHYGTEEDTSSFSAHSTMGEHAPLSEIDSPYQLETTTIVPYALPVQFTPLIGREQDVASACALLQSSDVRLLTLVGTGGIGKTRLSLQIATELMPHFADGVCFVPLASISDPELVISFIAYTLGLREASDWSQLERLYATLGSKQMLLLLDNFEQVVSAAPKLAELLDACPGLKIMVSSRAVLHIRGESLFFVQPLKLPQSKHLAAREDLTRYSAIALFLERARAAKPDFKATTSNIQTLANICIRLDGLPLALELAAARIKILSPQGLLARLENRLQILTSTQQDIPARQQTLRNTLAWSYDLLNAQEQRLFRQLAIFVEGCTLEAAEALCKRSEDGPIENSFSVLDGITSLIDKSLLHQHIQDEEEPRLVMLETIHEYGMEQLVASGEITTMQQAHAMFYLELAEMAERKLTGTEQGTWFERLQQDYENIKAALQWFMQQKEWEKSLRVGNALWRFWWARGYLSAGRQALEQALNGSQAMEIPTQIRAQALNAVGVLAGMQGDFGQSEAHCQEGLRLFREQENIQCCATSLWMLGNVALMKGNCVAARSLEEEALTLFREIDDSWGVASSLERLASVATDEGDFKQAILYGEKALELSRETGDIWGIARSLDRLGFVTFTQGNLARTEPLLTEAVLLSQKIGDKRTLAYSLAIIGYVSCIRGDYIAGRASLEESLKISLEVGDRRGRVWGLSGLGWAFFSQGDFAASRAYYEESLTILMKSDYAYKSFIALGLEGLAGAVAAQGHLTWSARLWGAADTIHTTDDGPPVPQILQPVYERLIAILRTQLGEVAFKSAWEAGRAMKLEQVLSDQEPIIIPAPPSVQAPQPQVSLTAREKDVLRLIARGLSSAQISAELFITVLTVNSHIRSIYSKIGVNSRSAATRYALDHHLAE